MRCNIISLSLSIYLSLSLYIYIYIHMLFDTVLSCFHDSMTRAPAIYFLR